MSRAKWNVGATAAVLVLAVYLGILVYAVVSGKTQPTDAMHQLQNAAGYVFTYLWGHASASQQQPVVPAS